MKHMPKPTLQDVAPVLAKGLKILDIEKSPRSIRLKNKSSFFEMSQHDHHDISWDGAKRSSGQDYFSERLTSKGYLPINHNFRTKQKKPDCPVPLGRQIVLSFTGVLLGEGRNPQVQVWGDPDTQSTLRAALERSSTWTTLERSRNMCGSQGCSMILCGLLNGVPFTELLDPKLSWVAEWDDSVPYWRPKVVVEQKRVLREEANEEGKLEEVEYWSTRAWSDKASIVFDDVPVKGHDREKDLTVAENGIVPHKLGVCPVVWYPNTDGENPYGQCDYEGLFENLDDLDQLSSQVHKSTLDNTDPSLLIKEMKQQKRRTIVRGGVIAVAPEGDARYLEMSGSSIQVAQEQVDREKREILQSANCVVIDQSYSGALQSSESMQMLFRAMETRAGVFRKSLERVIELICDMWVRFCRAYGVTSDKFGAEETVRSKVLLPPKVEDEDGEGKTEDHKLGEGGRFYVQWPPMFRPTPAQVASVAAALSTATGAKQYMSTQTATQIFSSYTGVEGEDEKKRVESEREENMSMLEEAFQNQPGPGQPGLAPGDGDPEDDGGEGPVTEAQDEKSPDEIRKPAAKAKRGKRGPEKPK